MEPTAVFVLITVMDGSIPARSFAKFAAAVLIPVSGFTSARETVIDVVPDANVVYAPLYFMTDPPSALNSRYTVNSIPLPVSSIGKLESAKPSSDAVTYTVPRLSRAWAYRGVPATNVNDPMPRTLGSSEITSFAG